MSAVDWASKPAPWNTLGPEWAYEVQRLVAEPSGAASPAGRVVTHRRWDPSEVAVLKAMRADKVPFKLIAKELRRTPDSVISKAAVL